MWWAKDKYLLISVLLFNSRYIVWFWCYGLELRVLNIYHIFTMFWNRDFMKEEKKRVPSLYICEVHCPNGKFVWINEWVLSFVKGY